MSFTVTLHYNLQLNESNGRYTVLGDEKNGFNTLTKLTDLTANTLWFDLM